MESKTVIITGIKGQIASYAADLYLNKGYKVIGLYRRCSTQDFTNIQHLVDNLDFELIEADICDSSSMGEIINKYKPYALLNFAAMSHVGSSYNQPIVTAEIDYLAVAKMLELIRLYSPKTKFWQASTSERFGDSNEDGYQNEDTLPSPISPYAAAKLASEYLIKVYRKAYNLHASYSIMFNSESPRRSREFVTRKITDYIGKTYNKISIESGETIAEAYERSIKDGIIKTLHLGNLDAYRSWTHASDTVNGIYKQVELTEPRDFLFGMEETHSIREFLTEAFNCVGVADWSNIVQVDKKFFRPIDVMLLKPDSTTAKLVLNWEPKYTFKELVSQMVSHDVLLNSANLQKEEYART